jgi:hypothetical protein
VNLLDLRTGRDLLRRNISLVLLALISVTGCVSPRYSATESFRQIVTAVKTILPGTRGLPACSIVHQPNIVARTQH